MKYTYQEYCYYYTSRHCNKKITKKKMKKWEQVISEVWTEHQRLINSSQSPRPPFRINYLGHSVENLQPIRYLQIKFSRRKTRSQQRVSVTAPQTSRFLDCFSCEIGPLQATIHVVQNRHTEEQKVALGQDKQRKLPFKIMYAFYLSCPSATFALQHGGFVRCEWLAARAYFAGKTIQKSRAP